MDFTNLNQDRKTKRKPTMDLGNMVFGKVPPQAKELEEVVLGALMLDTNCVYLGMSKLFPEIFYSEAHQRIFRAMQMLYDKNSPIDILTVINQLKVNEELDLIGGMFYITKLTNSVISGANMETHIMVISEMYLKRESIRLSGELISNAYEDATDAFEIINSADYGFQKIQERIIGSKSADISSFGYKVLEQHAKVKETGILGVGTGFSMLDAAMCGLVAPDLIIIAARPGQGKTAFALSVTYNTSVLSNIPCAWFSLEMDGVRLVRRLVSIDTGIDHARIRNGHTTQDEDKMIGESVDKISQSKIFIEDKASINVRDIRTRANLLKKKHKIGYIVVDYLQLMKGLESKNQTRENIVSEISRSLKELAKELEIPVIALSQLSREVEKRSDKLPQLSDLRESGGIEQDADEVIFLMRPEYYHMENSVEIGKKEYDPRGLTIVSIAKNRHGETKNIALNFTGANMHFTDHHLDIETTYTPPQKVTDKFQDENPF